VVISKAENWTHRETLWATALTGFAHTLSTILLGIVIGIIGYKLSETYEVVSHVIAPLVLVFMGLIYLSLNIQHRHDEHIPRNSQLPKRSKLAILSTLFAAMFFSPCLEIESYYLTAGTFGWPGILLVSVLYLVVTITLMVVLVALGYRGIERFKWHFLEHHEKQITGVTLIVLGCISFFINA
jgi:putative Mn2+ efflux pump MntP